jgi:hypothetical protein
VADDTLRALERRFRETGAASDEAAWLRERVRAGSLPADHLELVAYLGYEPARLAGSSARPPTWDEAFAVQLERSQDPARATLLTRRRYPQVWLHAAGPPSRPVLTRIALAAAWVLLERAQEKDLLAHETAAAAERWLLDAEDSEEARLRCVLAGDAATQARGSLTNARDWTWNLLDVSACAAYAAGSLTLAHGAEYAARAIAHTGNALGEGLSEGLPPSVLAAVQAELIPWALGEADPVRARRPQ